MERNLPSEERGTLEAIEVEEIQNVKTFLGKLYAIWNDFGINNEQKILRGRVVWKHLRNLLQEILDEEMTFYNDIKERIKNYTKKIEELSSLLSVTPKEEKSSSLIKKEENLRLELDNLTKLKHKRIKSYQDLRSAEAGYCSILGVPEHQLSSFNGIPSEKDLLEIEQSVKMLKEEKNKRYKKLCRVKQELTTILETTELTPETQLEKEILSGSDTVSLTHETLKALDEVVSKVHRKKAELEARKKSLIDKLTALWNRLRIPDSEKTEFLSKHTDCRISTLNSLQQELEKCEKIKKDNIKAYVDNLRQELEQLWNKCYASELDRKHFHLYCTKEMTDEVLEAHEAEVEKWKQHYEEAKSILTKIEKRKELWDLLLVFENKASDPNRFKNRRGNLLKEEKDRKKLQKDLPALENDIFCEIDLYETTSGKLFQYYGEDYRSFITNQWQERINQKENEKMERHKRLLQKDSETNFGTPAKKALLSTPKSAPSKLFKSNAGMSVFRTPNTGISKVMPSTVGRSVLTSSKFNSLQKSVVSHKLFSSKSSRPNFIKKKDQYVLRERNKSKGSSSSPNATTYSQFAAELNSTSRRSFRSSVLSTKKIGGTRISQNTSKTKRKSASKTLRRSMRNVSKTVPDLTPARGKLGLPFLI